MDFPVHHSTESTPRDRGHGLGAAQSERIAAVVEIYERLFPSMQRRVDWAGPVLETAENTRRRLLGQDRLRDRQRWRDRRLMALAAHKRRADRDIGK